MPLTSSEKRKVIRYRESLNNAIAALSTISDADIARFIMAVTITADADGFTSTTLTGGSSGSSSSSSTEAAALRGLPDDPNVLDDWKFHKPVDPIRSAAAELLHSIEVAVDSTKTIADRRAFILNVGESIRGRVSTIDSCICCGKDVSGVGEDRIRAGLCPGDYRAWLRAGRPDRYRWMAARRSESEESNGSNV